MIAADLEKALEEIRMLSFAVLSVDTAVYTVVNAIYCAIDNKYNQIEKLG